MYNKNTYFHRREPNHLDGTGYVTEIMDPIKIFIKSFMSSFSLLMKIGGYFFVIVAMLGVYNTGISGKAIIVFLIGFMLLIAGDISKDIAKGI